MLLVLEVVVSTRDETRLVYTLGGPFDSETSETSDSLAVIVSGHSTTRRISKYLSSHTIRLSSASSVHEGGIQACVFN